MTPKHLCILLLALVAFGTAAGQSEDIPIENDNQFPPDNHSEADVPIEGSGEGTIEEPITDDESTLAPPIEEVLTKVLHEDVPDVPVAADNGTEGCPSPCVCLVEGGTNNFVVDCSGKGLTKIPLPIDSRATTLNIQNNKITEIPKDVSALKNLKVLNADSNSITDLASGSISDLSELTVLKLSNNRLIEYPQDLKNSFSLTKLEELYLEGNDMRTALKSEIFSTFTSLRRLTLPTSTSDLLENLCSNLKGKLEYVCTASCDAQLYECSDAPHNAEDDLILPGQIPYDEKADPSTEFSQNSVSNSDIATPSEDSVPSDTTDEPQVSSTASTEGVSLQQANVAVGEDNSVKMTNAIVEAPKQDAEENKSSTDAESKAEKDVKVGATTTDATKTGGVDKSIIGFVVAGMVIIVAGITIKKNWSSIRKRFSSSPNTRTPERAGANANGTAPEEVPLQDKSPV